MMTKFLILLLPALAVAEIKINVRGVLGSEQDAKIEFDYTGQERHLVSDLERKTFKVDDDVLINIMKSQNVSLITDKVQVWDGYNKFVDKKYNWQEVYRSVRPVSVKLVRMQTSPKVVKAQISENNSSNKATFRVFISEEAETTFTTSWTNGGELSLPAQISFSFDFYFIKTGRSLNISMTSSWAKTQQTSNRVKIGLTSSLLIPLKPGQLALTQLIATYGRMELEVEYEASLSGQIVYFTRMVSGTLILDEGFIIHHPIEALMFINGINNTLRYVERITFDYYGDAKIAENNANLNRFL